MMKQKKYKNSGLLFLHIILVALFAFFTIVGVNSYNQNKLIGYVITVIILIIYFLVLKKSAKLFNKESVAPAYFLSISGFVALLFLQVMNCGNSYHWNMH